MCGIAGELRFQNAVRHEVDWDNISSMMSRRGPDDSGSGQMMAALCARIQEACDNRLELQGTSAYDGL